MPGIDEMEDFNNINLESSTLHLRATTQEDYITIKAGLMNQLPKQHKYDDEEIKLLEHFDTDFYRSHLIRIKKRASKDTSYLFRAFDRHSGNYLGGVIIKTIKRGDYQWGEIGYWLLNQHWGKGLGIELLRGGLTIAFKALGFHRIEAHINVDNTASQKTAVGAGMAFECTRPGFILEEDEWANILVYAINDLVDESF